VRTASIDAVFARDRAALVDDFEGAGDAYA
jgi:hypothetical protein